MSYKLDKPYTEEEYANFVVEHNHNNGRKIEETEIALFALEANEILVDGEPVINPNYEEEQAEIKRARFNKDFFNTSLGYVRRKVSMATGETKDFLSDLLPTISMGVQMGQPVTIITYNKPDFTQKITDWTALQNVQTVTAEFVQECFLQLSNDFKPVNNEEATNTTDISNEIGSTASEQDEINKDSIE